jgi:hypothetical protein
MENNYFSILHQTHPWKSQRTSEQIPALMYKLALTQKEEYQTPGKKKKRRSQTNKKIKMKCIENHLKKV